jgi:glucokinase-like ROK family protein
MSRTVRRIIGDMRSRDALARTGVVKGADQQFMREHNRYLVLNCVREHGPIARAAIARLTGLSRTTVGNIMDALLADELVREGETQSATSAGGRPATLVHFNASAGYIIGVDMGRSHLTILLTDLASHLVARRSGPFSTDLGSDVCLTQIVDTLNTFLSEQGVAWSRVVGLCIGIPAPLDTHLHRLYSPPRMPGWHGAEVMKFLRQRLAVPVYVENDANLGALGESRYGAGRGVTDLAYVKIGTGIGGGLVVGGQVYHGSRGSAGEIGHVAIDKGGPICTCGNRGCLEAVASADAIVAEAAAASSLQDGGTPNPDIADVVQAALLGDAACRAAIQRAGEHIGVALANLVNLANPSLILVDGAVARAGDLLLDPIRRAVASRSLAVASRHTRIAVGELGDNAIALGGVATVLDAAFTLRASPAPQGARTDGSASAFRVAGRGGALHTTSFPDQSAARDPPLLAGT